MSRSSRTYLSIYLLELYHLTSVLKMKRSQMHENMERGQMCCILRAFELFVSSYIWRRQSILYSIIRRKDTKATGEAG
jgi:hypothetical protein